MVRHILFISATLLATIIASHGMYASSYAAEKPASTAVYDFELIDTSLEGSIKGENADETRRLKVISDLLRQLLSRSGKYEVLDLTPVKNDIDDAGTFNGCNGCDIEIAKKLGASLAITGTVQKVSNLILNINIFVRDTATGRLKQTMSADIRGNTDQSWTRGVRWLVRNRLLAQD